MINAAAAEKGDNCCLLKAPSLARELSAKLTEGVGGAIPMLYKHNPRLTGIAKILRNNMTKEERHLWYDFLKAYPVKFLRQKVIGDYIVDFYCAKARLVIELDGSHHYEQKGLLRDTIRTEYIEAYDLIVVRIPNNEVTRNFEGVCEYIDSFVKESLRQAEPATSL